MDRQNVSRTVGSSRQGFDLREVYFYDFIVNRVLVWGKRNPLVSSALGIEESLSLEVAREDGCSYARLCTHVGYCGTFRDG